MAWTSSSNFALNDMTRWVLSLLCGGFHGDAAERDFKDPQRDPDAPFAWYEKQNPCTIAGNLEQLGLELELAKRKKGIQSPPEPRPLFCQK